MRHRKQAPRQSHGVHPGIPWACRPEWPGLCESSLKKVWPGASLWDVQRPAVTRGQGRGTQVQVGQGAWHLASLWVMSLCHSDNRPGLCFEGTRKPYEPTAGVEGGAQTGGHAVDWPQALGHSCHPRAWEGV